MRMELNLSSSFMDFGRNGTVGFDETEMRSCGNARFDQSQGDSLNTCVLKLSNIESIGQLLDPAKPG